MSELFYDEQIAPVLMELAEKCRDNGLSMVASVQYGTEDRQRGDTYMLQPDAQLPIMMIKHCAATAPNIDSYLIGLAGYCKKHGIDISSSIFLGRFAAIGEAMQDKGQS